MRRCMLLLIGLASLGLIQAARAADRPPAADRILPSDALIVLQVPDTGALLDLILQERLVSAVATSPAYQKASATPEFQQMVHMVAFLESKFGTDWKTALRRMTQGGVTLAALPGDSVLLVVDAADAKLLHDLHEVAVSLARSDAVQKGKADPVVSADYRGVTGWTLGAGEAHAIVGNRLLLANKAETLRAAIDLQTGDSGAALAGVPAYRAACEAQADAAALLYVNTGVLKQLPGALDGLKQQRNPLGSLLLAPLLESLAGSNWLSLGIRPKENTLVMELATDAQAGEGPGRFALPASADQGAPVMLHVPRQMAGMSLYRDFHAFYAAKDELFPQRTSELIFFENMMGIFFTGRDLTEEVFAELQPEVRVAVAGQQYDPAVGTPQTPIPGFALVFRMKDPKRFGPVMEEAYQKALGLVNFTRGQKAEPGMIIDRTTHGEVKYTVARFSPGPDDDPAALDLRFNFQPTLAMPGEYVILSSSESLARDLIDAVSQPSDAQAGPLAGVHTCVELEGVALGELALANRENLIRQNMLEEGSTHEVAEASINGLLAVLQRIGRTTLRIGQTQGHAQARLEITLNPGE